MAVFVISEIGVNHDGSLDKAKRLIDAAKEAGADAVKFQFFSSHKLWGDDRIKHLELSLSDMILLHTHCARVGIEFMCTPFGVDEVIWLYGLVKRWKIASGCLTRKSILEAVRDTNLPVILSTGMRTIDEILAAIAILDCYGTCRLTLLHCTSSYPCKLEDVNLLAMESLPRGYPVGYSDHTTGITVAIAAAAMGATVIEKHLTFDRQAEGPDHKASIEPKDFRTMVEAIRTVEQALGDGVKRVMPSEVKLREQWHVASEIDSPSGH